jgi:hypothetical protein
MGTASFSYGGFVRRLFCGAAAAACALASMTAPASADLVCRSDSARDVRLWVDKAADGVAQRPALLYAYSRLPIDGDAQIAVVGQKPGQETAGAKISNFRVLVTDATNAQGNYAAANLVYDTAWRARKTGAAQALSKIPADRQDEARDAIETDAASAMNQAAGDMDTTLVDGLGVTPSAATSDNGLVTAKRIATGDLLVNFTVPSPYVGGEWSPFGRNAQIVVIACDTSDKAVFISQQKTLPLSFKWWSIAFALVPVLAIYLLVAGASRSFDRRHKQGATKTKYANMTYFKALNPVLLTSGPDGKGSLARLQIMFFTVLISSILAFLLFRIGYLSDMSNTVLELLGISAIGAAATKATDGTQNRLKPENWAWLTSRNWMPANGLGPYTTPRWRDLVVSPEDGFDVYHFQMLVFSLVVAVALLQGGCTNIASFQIPNTLLGVLGLSQAAYVGGKLVAPPTYGDFDKLLTDLRTMEDDYVKICSDEKGAQLAFATALPGSPAAIAATNAGLALLPKKATAEIVFETQMRKVESYFATVFGTLTYTNGLTGRPLDTALPVI